MDGREVGVGVQGRVRNIACQKCFHEISGEDVVGERTIGFVGGRGGISGDDWNIEELAS